jgi:hypothetical protein
MPTLGLYLLRTLMETQRCTMHAEAGMLRLFVIFSVLGRQRMPSIAQDKLLEVPVETRLTQKWLMRSLLLMADLVDMHL